MENIILNDDCFNVFSKIPSKSVQLVCVDLPYNSTAISWDKEIIDLDKMWVQLKRIGKENCKYVFFCTTKFGIDLILSNRKWFRYDIIWEKTSNCGFLSAKKMPLRNHEMIYVFNNDKKPKDLNWIYNPQMVLGKPHIRNNNKKKKNKDDYLYGDSVKLINISNNKTGMNYPKSILKISNNNEKGRFHPTQKPVALCEWIVKTYSNEGDLVLDFTMGSGSTVVACINTKRRYIGIEKDKNIFETAQNRINNIS